MTTVDAPAPFTAADFTRRMERAADAAAAAGLTGLIVTPGPDLIYLAGYMPVAITERLTRHLTVTEDGGRRLNNTAAVGTHHLRARGHTIAGSRRR